MKPLPAEALPKLAVRLLTEHLPALGENYRASDIGLLGPLMLICAEHAADGGRRERNELAALRQLLQQGQSEAAEANNTALCERIEQALTATAAEVSDPGHIAPDRGADSAQMQQQLNELRSVLIDYHAWVEQQFGGDSAQNRRIWTLLAEFHAASRLQTMKLLAQLSAAKAADNTP